MLTRPAGGRRSIAVSFVTLAITYGVWYSYSVFLVALLREFAWSRTLLGGAFSVFALVHGFASPSLGSLADRVGPRRLVAAGGAILLAGLLLDSVITRPWQLYLAFGVVTSLGVAASGWVPAVVLVQRWFPERVGAAIGLTSAGIGVGIFLVVPACQWLIDVVGWRGAFRALAVATALWTIPMTLLLVRDPRPSARATLAIPGGPALTLGEVIRLPRVWLLALGQTSANCACQMLLVHQAAYLVDHGITAMIAASVVSVVGLASIVGKVGGGWLSDGIGRETTYSLGMACVVASLGALALVAIAPGAAPAYLYGALIGVGYSVTAALMPAVAADLFRGPNFGAIFGTLHLANAAGGSLGPWIGGRIFDATGSYRAAFVVAGACALFGTMTLWLTGPRRGAIAPARKFGLDPARPS